jgi:hypothetical protein
MLGWKERKKSFQGVGFFNFTIRTLMCNEQHVCWVRCMYVCKAQETICSSLFKYGQNNQTLVAIHGTTFKAWIQTHGKLEAVSAALTAVILNGGSERCVDCCHTKWRQ